MSIIKEVKSERNSGLIVDGKESKIVTKILFDNGLKLTVRADLDEKTGRYIYTFSAIITTLKIDHCKFNELNSKLKDITYFFIDCSTTAVGSIILRNLIYRLIEVVYDCPINLLDLGQCSIECFEDDNKIGEFICLTLGGCVPETTLHVVKINNDDYCRISRLKFILEDSSGSVEIYSDTNRKLYIRDSSATGFTLYGIIARKKFNNNFVDIPLFIDSHNKVSELFNNCEFAKIGAEPDTLRIIEILTNRFKQETTVEN